MYPGFSKDPRVDEGFEEVAEWLETLRPRRREAHSGRRFTQGLEDPRQLRQPFGFPPAQRPPGPVPGVVRRSGTRARRWE